MNDLIVLLELLDKCNQHPTHKANLSFCPGNERGKITLQALDNWGDSITTTFSFSSFKIAAQKMEALIAES
jgi:hypothetical protein